jgi:peptidyl-prolyl cis-trans isomerase C
MIQLEHQLKGKKWLVGLSLATAVTAVSGQEVPKGSFAVVNDQPLSEALLEVNVQANVQRGQPDTPQLRARLAQELVGQEVLAQEAQKLKLDQTAQAQAVWAQMQQNFLTGLLLENFAQTNPVTEAQIKAEYDAFVKQMQGAKQYKLSIITVADQSRAKSLIAELQASKDKGLFARLASKESIDESNAKGGALDWLLPEQMLPAVGNVVVNLSKGQLSAVPIQTPAGWNVVRVDEIRGYTPPAMTEVEPQLRQAAAQKALAQYVQGLRQKAKILQ